MYIGIELSIWGGRRESDNNIDVYVNSTKKYLSEKMQHATCYVKVANVQKHYRSSRSLWTQSPVNGRTPSDSEGNAYRAQNREKPRVTKKGGFTYQGHETFSTLQPHAWRPSASLEKPKIPTHATYSN